MVTARKLLIATAALFLAAAPALALEKGDTLGKTAAEVSQTLAGMGYDVRKVETDDGKIEAEVAKDGQRLEIYVDPATGTVSRIKEDD